MWIFFLVFFFKINLFAQFRYSNAHRNFDEKMNLKDSINSQPLNEPNGNASAINNGTCLIS